MAALQSSPDYQRYHAHKTRPSGLPKFDIITETISENEEKRGVKVIPGESFAALPSLVSKTRTFSAAHGLSIQQVIDDALVVYKKWNEQVAVIAEANAEFHRRTGESQAERAREIEERRAREDAILGALDLEAIRHTNEVLEDAKSYFQRDNQNRWPINQKGNNVLKGEAMGLVKDAYVDGVYEGSLRYSKGCHPCRLAGCRPCNLNYPECIYVDRFGFLRAALAAYSFNKELYKEARQEDVPGGWEGAGCF